MEGSGTTVNMLLIAWKGTTIRQPVVADRDRIELGPVSFDRREFLLAIGLCQADLDALHGKAA